MDRPDKTLIDYRPWGNFKQYCLNEPVTVKVIAIDPGQKLSTQKHENRDELWVALDGGIVASVDGEETGMGTYCEVWIPRGAVHFAINRHYHQSRILEISFGTFDESDITRLEDKYGRVKNG